MMAQTIATTLSLSLSVTYGNQPRAGNNFGHSLNSRTLLGLVGHCFTKLVHPSQSVLSGNMQWLNNPLSPSLSSKPSSNRNKEIERMMILKIYIAISIGRSTSLNYSS
jgi:hypothetical protein